MGKSVKRYVTSKLRKTKALAGNKRLLPHIPRTRRLRDDSLKRMLLRYRMAYVKPVHGLKGQGIMRAARKGKRYQLRHGKSRVYFRSLRDLCRIVRRRAGGRPYLVQRGIRLLRYRGRPFDFRIMVQKNEKRRWEVSGIVGRVAPPHRIVTNRSQGGRCHPARRLLRHSLKESAAIRLLARLYRLSRKVGRQFQRVYPNAWQLGVDVAVSRSLKPWILEVNTNPAVTPFIRLGNRRMYRRIVRLIRWNRSESRLIR